MSILSEQLKDIGSVQYISEAETQAGAKRGAHNIIRAAGTTASAFHIDVDPYYGGQWWPVYRVTIRRKGK